MYKTVKRRKEGHGWRALRVAIPPMLESKELLATFRCP